MRDIVGWALIVVGGAVMFAAFPGKYGGEAPLAGFIGSVGLPFGLVFTAVQYGVAAGFRKAKVLWLVTALFASGAMMGAIGRALDVRGFCTQHDISYAEYILCGAACVSGIGLGIAILRGWVDEE